MSLPPAIVLGIETPIGLALVRELGGHGVPVHGVARTTEAIGLGSRWLAGSSLRGSGAIADWLPGLIAQTGARALFAVSEGDLIALAQLGPMIGDCRLLTPAAGPLAVVLDKSATLAAGHRLGIDTPESWQPMAGEDHAARAALLDYPVVAKWADPAHVVERLEAAHVPLVKAEFVHDPAALVALLDRYAPFGMWPLVQRYCAGHGLGQMLYMANGRATLRFQHRRLHEWPPEGGVSTLCAAEPLDRHATQMALSEALLAAIGWEGPAMVEYRHDPSSGRYALMEINGRFWGSLPLARASGAHFAWEGYRREILGDASPAPPPRADLRARYMIPETRRLLRTLFQRSQIADPYFRARPLADLASYALGFVDPRMRYFVFSPSDPRPFLIDFTAGLRKLVPQGKPSRAAPRRARSV